MAEKADLLDTLAQGGTVSENEGIILSNLTRSDDKSVLKKRARAKSYSEAISVGLVEASEKSDGAKIKSYWSSFWCASIVSEHTDGKVTSKYCKQRWCLVCNRIKTATLINRYLPDIKNWMAEEDVYFLTLTRPNVPADELSDEIKSLNGIFSKIAAAAKQKNKRGTGPKFVGIRKTECTYNPRRRDFNPHLHILVKGEKYAQYVHSQWLKRNPTADIKAQSIEKVTDGRGLLEVFKYSTKMIVKVGEKRKVYMDALHTIYCAFDKTQTLKAYGFKSSNPNPVLGSEERTRAAVLKEYEWDKYQSDWMATQLDIDMDTGEVLGVISDPLSGYSPGDSFREFLDTAFVIQSGENEYPIDRLKDLPNPDTWQNYRMKPIEDPEP